MILICQSVEADEAAVDAVIKQGELLRVAIALVTESERLRSVKE